MTTTLGATEAPTPTTPTEIQTAAGALRMTTKPTGLRKIELHVAGQWRTLADDLPEPTAHTLLQWMAGQDRARLVALVLYK